MIRFTWHTYYYYYRQYVDHAVALTAESATNKQSTLEPHPLSLALLSAIIRQLAVSAEDDDAAAAEHHQHAES